MLECYIKETDVGKKLKDTTPTSANKLFVLYKTSIVHCNFLKFCTLSS